MNRQHVIIAVLLVFSLCAAFARPGGAQSRQRVSLVLLHGKVFTGDERGTLAQAVAIDGNRIVAVGTDAGIAARYVGAQTLDLKGRLVTAGFNDAHLHFLGGGLSLLRVELLGAPSLEEAKRRIAAKAKELGPGAWITGRGWDHTLWGGQWPTRQDLDAVAPDNPVFVQRVDGHVSWCNSLALQKAGVTKDTKAPDGGEILREADGTPTGILKETAANLVGSVVPAPTREEQLKALAKALGEAQRYGITSIQDNSGYETTKLYRELLKQGKLTVRVAEWQNFEDTIAELKRQRAEFAAFQDDPFRLRLTALKGYVDGTLGSRTAAMLAPFADDPHNSGIPRHTPEELSKMIVERDAAGFQIALHAIGDRANRMALEGFGEALENYTNNKDSFFPKPDSKEMNDLRKGTPAVVLGGFAEVMDALNKIKTRRHRIEHAQVVAPSDFQIFKMLGVLASMQPSHAISDKRWAQDRLGEYRVQGAYAWHRMKAYGVHVPFGTDWPVEPINPYLGLYAAVTRQSTDGEPKGGWWPQERLTIAEAIRCYTAESAYASFEENDKGQIAAGLLADLVVHSRDLLTIKPEEIWQTEAAVTIFEGKVVYEKEK